MAVKSDAEKQGMVTEKTTSDLSFDKFIEQVQVACGVWNKASLKFVSACAGAFLNGAFATDDKQRRKMDEVSDTLKATLRGANIGKSQTYNYIQTALTFARAIAKNKANGVLAGFLSAANEHKAVVGLQDALERHSWLPDSKPLLAWSDDADGKPVFSIDVLRVNLGLDNLVKFKADGITPVKRKGAKARGGSARKRKGKEATATQAAPDSVIKRLEQDTDLQGKVSPETITGMASTVVGRVEMVRRLVSLMTLEELSECQKEWKKWHAERAKALASDNARTKADKADTEAAAG